MTTEQKARAYDEALSLMKDCIPDKDGYVTIRPSDIFPELKESEDKKIRKAIIESLPKYGYLPQTSIKVEDAIAWLESKEEQYNNEDLNILQRFSFYSYKDEPNILYLSGLYVNEKCRNKGIGTKILEVADEVAKSLNCHAIRLKTKIGSNAERLYRRNQYHTLKREDNQVWLEKQGEKPADDIQKSTDIKIHKGDKNNPYDMSFEEAQNYITKRDFDICCTDYAVYADDRYILQTIANVLRWADDNPKQIDNKIEPRFKVGDFIMNDYCMGKVIELTDDAYLLDTGQGIPFSCEHNAHLWTIADAKDGDVLCYESKYEFRIFIYKNGHIHYHCHYCNGHLTTVDSYFIVEKYLLCYIHPATKEQRDLLFEKMKETGYEWDAEKKELKKIEQKSAWSTRDEMMLDNCLHFLKLQMNHHASTCEIECCIDWLKSIKQRMEEQL